jgi:hypothetical protein
MLPPKTTVSYELDGPRTILTTYSSVEPVSSSIASPPTDKKTVLLTHRSINTSKPLLVATPSTTTASFEQTAIGQFPLSPETSNWNRRKQVYQSLLNYKLGKIKITTSLWRTAQRCGIEASLKLSSDEIKDRLKTCAEKCEYFLKTEHKHRKKNLQQRPYVMRATSNGVVEKRTLEITRREKERSKWKRLGVAYWSCCH